VSTGEATDGRRGDGVRLTSGEHYRKHEGESYFHGRKCSSNATTAAVNHFI
jgi:hypothetical protein